MRRELVISSELVNIEKVRLFLEQIFLDARLNRRSFNRVYLGLSEAVNNAIIHGNNLNSEKQVYILIYYFEGILMIEVKDEGEGFPFDYIEDPTIDKNLKKESGRGIFLIRNIADNIQYFDGGRSVAIKYNIVR